jgi:Helix-turn-helix domain
MSDADDFECDSAVTDRDANGPPGADRRAAPPVADVLLTARRVAALLGRTCRTLRNWERRGWLRPIRIGRSIFYRPSDIEPSLSVEPPSQPPACSGPGLMR